MLPSFTSIAEAVRASRAVSEPFASAHAGAHGAATSPWNARKTPTEAQMRAGNYAMGVVWWQGMRLHIENPAHTVREGADPDGTPWRNTMLAHYGYFAGTRGADGDGVDVFLGPLPESEAVWVLNQTDGAGQFDEHKVLAGFVDERAAVDAYRLSYSPGWSRFGPPVRLSLAQLRWWLKYGDLSRPLSTDILPPEPAMNQANDLPTVLWDSAAEPLHDMNLSTVLYRIRVNDAREGLMMDPVTMADLIEGAEIVRMDALVTMAGMLKPKMDALQRVMEAAAGEVKPLAMQITEPVRRFGGVHVAVLFELSDGQTVTIWFHNPDSTPARLSPADDLVSWKWQLNKKDITIVVAPEKGKDLNVREVARRIMRLAEKNSAAFQRANARRAATVAEVQGLKDTLASKQAELASLQQQIEVAKVEREERTAQTGTPEWKARDFDPVANYMRIRGNEDAMLYWQDALDSTFQGRIVEVRNALRDLGWEGEQNGTLTFNGATLGMKLTQVGAGRNVVGVLWTVTGNLKPTATYGADGLLDDLEATPAELAQQLHMDVALPEAAAEDAGRRVIGGVAFIAERRESRGVKYWVAKVEKTGEVFEDQQYATRDKMWADYERMAEKAGDGFAKAYIQADSDEPDGQAATEQPDWDTYPEGEYAQWEDKLTTMVEFRQGADRGDAQGLVEAQDMMDRGVLRRLFESNYTAEAAYQKLFGEGAGTTGGGTDPAPTPDPEGGEPPAPAPEPEPEPGPEPAPAPAPEPAPAPAPAPAADLPDNVFADIEPEAFALLAANREAYAAAVEVENAVARAGGAVAWVTATTEPVMDDAKAVRPVLDSLFELDGARFVRGDISYRARPIGAVTINGQGQAFFVNADGTPFNGLPEDDLEDAKAANLIGWTGEIDTMVSYMLAVEVTDPIDEEIASGVNKAENAADDAEDDMGAPPGTILDRGNDHWKRTLSDLAQESRSGKTALLGTLHRGGKRVTVNVVRKNTNRAEWYVVMHEEGRAKVKDSLPFPGMTGPMKALKAAGYLMGYLDAEEPSGWKIAPPGVEVPAEDGDQNPVLQHAQAVRRELAKIGWTADEQQMRVERDGAMHVIRWDYEGPEAEPTGVTFRAVKLVNGVQVDDFDGFMVMGTDPETAAIKLDNYVRSMAAGPYTEDIMDREKALAYIAWSDKVQSALEAKGLTASAAQGLMDDKSSEVEALWKAQAAPSSAADSLMPAPAESAEAKFLREVKAGAHDAADLGDLLARIEASVRKLEADGLLTGELDADAAAAITHWVALDEKANG